MIAAVKCQKVISHEDGETILFVALFDQEAHDYIKPQFSPGIAGLRSGIEIKVSKNEMGYFKAGKKYTIEIKEI